jgi:hypothetical protein
LVFIHENVLLGVPFDPVKLELRGTPSPVFDDTAGDPITGAAQFDFAGAFTGSGTFIYRNGMRDRRKFVFRRVADSQPWI